MIRWLVVVAVSLVLINLLAPWLQKMGLGKLPGDFEFKLSGRIWFIPLGSTVLLSLLASWVARIL